MWNCGIAKTSFFNAYQDTPWNPFSGRKELPQWPLFHDLFSQNKISYAEYVLIQRMLAHHPDAKQEVALFIFYLILASKNGHVCVQISKEVCHPDIGKLLQIDGECDYLNPLVHAIQKGSKNIPKDLIAEQLKEENFVIAAKPMYKNGDFFYLQKSFYFETLFLRNLLSCLERQVEYSFSESIHDEVLKKIEKKVLLQAQGEAIIRCLSHPLTIVTGGPGTGKTYLVGQLLHTIMENISLKNRRQFQIALAAPTGKAVARLQSSMKDLGDLCHDFPVIQTKTLHALLEIKEHTVHPENVRLSADLLIVDESSMIDLRMMAYLFEALKPGSRIVFLGDQDQLPSVEMGHPFIDLIELKDAQGRSVIPTTILRECVRTEIVSLIEFAQVVNRGTGFEVIHFLKNEKKSEIQFKNLCEVKRNELLEEAVSQFSFNVEKEIEPEELISCFQRFRILSPIRKGFYGVDTWNEWIWDVVRSRFPKRGWVQIPIMITVNDYDVQLFNGETGVLVRRVPIGLRYGAEDYVLFPSRENGQIRKISALLLPRHELAYCLSVHKSQGSEFDHVMFMLPESDQMSRELFYTGITRARQSIDIISSEEVIMKMVQEKQNRVSGVSVRFRESLF